MKEHEEEVAIFMDSLLLSIPQITPYLFPRSYTKIHVIYLNTLLGCFALHLM